MTASTYTSLTQLADANRTIEKIGVVAVSRAKLSTLRPSELAADVFAAAGLAAAVDIWRRLQKQLLDPYRPELHYMRGPGPKWREKHGRTLGGGI
jgi:hypothetical protein